MENLPLLRRVAVAFTFQERMYIRRQNAGLWKKSAALQGMVCRIVQVVPKNMALSWLDEEDTDGISKSPGACIPGGVLQDMAAMYGPLRGMLALGLN